MSMSEEELAIEVGKINGIEIYDVNVAKTSGDQIFKQLASNTTSAYDKDARLQGDQHMSVTARTDSLPHGSGCKESRGIASEIDRVA